MHRAGLAIPALQLPQPSLKVSRIDRAYRLVGPSEGEVFLPRVFGPLFRYRSVPGMYAPPNPSS